MEAQRVTKFGVWAAHILDCKVTVSLCKSILKATKQGNLDNLVKELVSVPLHHFSVRLTVSVDVDLMRICC